GDQRATHPAKKLFDSMHEGLRKQWRRQAPAVCRRGRRQTGHGLQFGDRDLGGLDQGEHLDADLELQLLDRARRDHRGNDAEWRLDIDFGDDRPFDDFLDLALELVAGIDGLDGHEIFPVEWMDEEIMRNRWAPANDESLRSLCGAWRRLRPGCGPRRRNDGASRRRAGRAYGYSCNSRW